jgi:hypothetical protein
MTGTLSVDWAPTKERIERDSPFSIKDMVSTMRKVEQTVCKKLAPRGLIHNRAVPKANGNESVASGWLNTATRVRETGVAKVEDVFGGGTLACAALLPMEAEEARGFPRLRDPVIIPPEELERQDAELCDADKERGKEKAMEAAQPVEDERFSAEEDMEYLPEDDAGIAGASMGALTLPAAEEGGDTSAGLDTERGPASLNPRGDVPATEPRRPCVAQSYKEVSTRAAQVPTLLPAGTEPLMEDMLKQSLGHVQAASSSSARVSPPKTIPPAGPPATPPSATGSRKKRRTTPRYGAT